MKPEPLPGPGIRPDHDVVCRTGDRPITPLAMSLYANACSSLGWYTIGAPDIFHRHLCLLLAIQGNELGGLKQSGLVRPFLNTELVEDEFPGIVIIEHDTVD